MDEELVDVESVDPEPLGSSSTPDVSETNCFRPDGNQNAFCVLPAFFFAFHRGLEKSVRKELSAVMGISNVMVKDELVFLDVDLRMFRPKVARCLKFCRRFYKRILTIDTRFDRTNEDIHDIMVTSLAWPGEVVKALEEATVWQKLPPPLLSKHSILVDFAFFGPLKRFRTLEEQNTLLQFIPKIMRKLDHKFGEVDLINGRTGEGPNSTVLLFTIQDEEIHVGASFHLSVSTHPIRGFLCRLPDLVEPREAIDPSFVVASFPVPISVTMEMLRVSELDKGMSILEFDDGFCSASMEGIPLLQLRGKIVVSDDISKSACMSRLRRVQSDYRGLSFEVLLISQIDQLKDVAVDRIFTQVLYHSLSKKLPFIRPDCDFCELLCAGLFRTFKLCCDGNGKVIILHWPSDTARIEETAACLGLSLLSRFPLSFSSLHSIISVYGHCANGKDPEERPLEETF